MSLRTAVYDVDSRQGKTFVRLTLVPHALSEIAAVFNDTYLLRISAHSVNESNCTHFSISFNGYYVMILKFS